MVPKVITKAQKVMVFGTFDILHAGHRSFLRNAKAYGKHLTVVIGRDLNVTKYKKKAPFQKEDKRLLHVKELSFVDEAILGRIDHNYEIIIKNIKPDVICLGYDQDDFGLREVIKRKFPKIKIFTLEAYKPELYKTSILRKDFEI